MKPVSGAGTRPTTNSLYRRAVLQVGAAVLVTLLAAFALECGGNSDQPKDTTSADSLDNVSQTDMPLDQRSAQDQRSGNDLASDAPESDIAAPLPTLDEVTPGGCQAPPYQFLDPKQMGHLVAVEHMPDLSITRAKIDVMAAAAGVTTFSPVPYDVTVYRFRYTTQDRGQEVEATGLMAFPKLEQKQEVPTAVWMHQTTGMEDFCSPSGRGLLWAMPAIMLASLGQAVVAPDYIGQNGFGDEAPFYHAYLMGEPAALGSLDAVRALWAFAESDDAKEVNALPSKTLVLAGGSQGGNVALWAQRYVDVYLPEANVEAVVAIAPPTDLLGMLESGTTTLSIGGVGMAMALMTARDWYKGTASLDEVLAPKAVTFIQNILDTQCPKAEMPAEVTAISDIYSTALIESVAAGTFNTMQPWYCYFFENSLANSKVPLVRQAPVLYITGELDDISITPVQRLDVARLCDKGYQIQHIECAGLGHFDTALNAMPLAWQWVKQIRDGKGIAEEKMCVVAEPSECDG